ncbi:LysR family transcriptional regulator [Litoribrevibacter albus]|uniref:LysR family transcriptional regulator n=1 Tax=Litoribrevibacter albus TaxID=1473156 RepID=A0AA37SD82_9GAMM|nr:LysR family transcriptional regulator [Litoribrevibacter albus]GLQ32750.1 LysR family transcriptional regulator [Litoribrevibacter albus]
MNTLHLKALLLAIETGSISAAARKLGKTQPQVSQWISDLECDLGVTFFERSGNKTSLTADGQRLLPALSHSLSQLDHFIDSAYTLADSEPTVLTIGLEHFLPKSVFIQPVSEILSASETASLNVEVYRDDKTGLVDALVSGEVDLILIHESEIVHHSQFEYCRLGGYHEILVCGTDHPLAKEKTVSTALLSQYRELVWGDADVDSNDGFSSSYGVFSDVSTVTQLLIQNQGFAFLPKDAVTSLIESGQLKALDCDFETQAIERRVELCWRNGLALSKRGEAVITAFQQHHQLLI